MAKILSTLIFAAVVSVANAQIIPLGELCSGIAGPIYGTCTSGTICCAVGPDRSLCAAVSSCPSQFVPVNGLCSGIAGPSPYPCWPGTTCCNISPDNSV
ncbi:hypothetical protein CVT24_002076 [Panaeolus cyanescens]|uniref:Hydrophobin n=1 Tax=Panaeolus cyanescens TaxID=181874 RepID=A0A409W1J5_9AGAR|nr:hypothetical protein CVT24_002076 [Panaeolus cyanescens]